MHICRGEEVSTLSVYKIILVQTTLRNEVLGQFYTPVAYVLVCSTPEYVIS